MSAAALNSFHNILLRQTLNSSYTITVINHPRPRNVRAQVDISTLNFTGFAVGTLVVFGYSFLIATFILFIVQEKETKVSWLGLYTVVVTVLLPFYALFSLYTHL